VNFISAIQTGAPRKFPVVCVYSGWEHAYAGGAPRKGRRRLLNLLGTRKLCLIRRRLGVWRRCLYGDEAKGRESKRKGFQSPKMGTPKRIFELPEGGKGFLARSSVVPQ